MQLVPHQPHRKGEDNVGVTFTLVGIGFLEVGLLIGFLEVGLELLKIIDLPVF